MPRSPARGSSRRMTSSTGSTPETLETAACSSSQPLILARERPTSTTEERLDGGEPVAAEVLPDPREVDPDVAEVARGRVPGDVRAAPRRGRRRAPTCIPPRSESANAGSSTIFSLLGAERQYHRGQPTRGDDRAADPQVGVQGTLRDEHGHGREGEEPDARDESRRRERGAGKIVAEEPAHQQ